VVKELSEIKARIVGFTDDNFAFDMDRVGKICDLLLAQGIKKTYIINARLEIAKRPEVLAKMKRAGFAGLMLGIESAHDKTLASMRKGFDTAKIREYFQTLRQSGLFLHGYFIVGNIGESAEEMLQIGPFARELGLDTIGLSALRSNPYSGLDELVASCPGYRIAPGGKVYSDELSLDDLTALRRRIAYSFYTPGQILRIFRKGVRNGALAFIPGFLLGLPEIVWNKVRHVRRKRQRQRRAADKAALAPGKAAV
jgi:anaerobic magnesium-protoporphyrin IX monomethyl ester cyclase